MSIFKRGRISMRDTVLSKRNHGAGVSEGVSGYSLGDLRCGYGPPTWVVEKCGPH